jgi:hypothetical protein
MDFMETRALVKAMFKPTSYLLMAYILCLNCGRISVEGILRTFCRSPLLGANHKQEINDEVYIEDIEGENPPFLLPINPYFGFHSAFYRVTGTGETGAALSLSIKAEKAYVLEF